MRVFVAGATGVAGRRLIPLLTSSGHDVTAVARSAERGAMLERNGAKPLNIDLFDPAAVRVAVAGHDAVINVATHIPPASKAFLPGAWRENDRIRREVSRNLVDAAIAGGASRVIQESFAGLYPDRGDDWIDETVEPQPASHVRSTLDAERQALRFTASGGTGVVLRFAQFCGPEASYTVDMVDFARKGVASTFGAPDDFISSIQLDDVATAVVAALKVDSGLYNVGDDEPVRRRAYFASLANALGVRAPWLAPAWVAGLFGSIGRTVARSQRLSNARFKAASGWAPRYRSIADAWPDVVAQIQRRSKR